MSARYAQGTEVPVERSRAEVERILTRYGATRFGSMTEPTRATIYFEVKGRQVQLPVPMPQRTDKKIAKNHNGWARSESGIQKAIDQETRRRWRVLVITLKSMLESVESGLMTFDQVFLAHLVIPGTARTIGEAIAPKLDAICNGTALPALLQDNPTERG